MGEWVTISRPGDPDGSGAPAILGRERELAFLKGKLAEAATGRALCVAIDGEPGIGKTHLLKALAATAVAEGAIVIQGAAFEAEGMPPYLLFLEALGPFIRNAEAESLRRLTEGRVTTLASIFPELVARLGPIDTSYALPPEQARLRLFESVADMLAAIAATAPLVLMLDDLHWADRASLDLLCHVLRYQPHAPMLIAATFRQGEASSSRALERALDDLTRLRRLHRLSLRPLEPAEISCLVAGWLGGPPDDRTAAVLYSQSEGNPFFAEELLRDWKEAGILRRTPDGGRWSLPDQMPTALPASIAGAVRQRLARLSTEHIDPLRVASIVGRSFAIRLLAELLEQPEETVEQILRPSVEAGLILDAAPGQYAFAHEKIREVLYIEVSALRRQRLHERIGLALEAESASRDAQKLSALAFHFVRSPDRVRGARYSRQAGVAALRAYAAEEAIAHFRTALESLDRSDPSRGETSLGLGEAYLLSGAEEEAAAQFRTLLAQVPRGEDPLTRARAAHGLGLALWRRDALEDARQALQEGLAELGDLTARSEAVMLRVDLATLLGIILGRMPESLEHARKGLARARGLRDPRWQAPATRTVGFLMVLDNRIQEGLPMLEEALRLAEAADDPAEAAEVCSALAQTYAWLGQVDRSREISLRREAFALRCHQPYPLRYVYSWLAFLDSVQGSWIAASSKLELASAAVARMSSHRPAAFLEQVRGFLAYQRGDFALAEQSMRIALETFRSRDPLEYVLCLGTLALALRSRGKNPEADACRDDLTSLLNDVSSGSLVIGSARSCLGLLAIAGQDARRAADLYPLLLPFRGQHHWFLVDRVLGGLATLLGDFAAAAAHLSEAEALAAREHIRPEHTRLLIMQAEVTQRERSPQAKERAGHLRTTSQAMLRDLNLSYDVQAAMLGIRGGAGGRLHHPAGLSEREVEVLKLLAGGLSNRDIAQSLALSEHTVAKHLTSIFNKTGVDNRAGAVAFAVRNGLA